MLEKLACQLTDFITTHMKINRLMRIVSCEMLNALHHHLMPLEWHLYSNRKSPWNNYQT